MTVIDLEPLVMTNAELIIGTTDDYSEHVSRVEFTPARQIIETQTLGPKGTHSKAGKASWSVNIDGPQDWTTPKSLTRHLFDHDGEWVTLKFKPEAGTGMPSWTVEVQLLAGGIGGAVNAGATSSVTLPCKGRPVPDYDDNDATPNPAD